MPRRKFGFGLWAADDTLLPTNTLSVKFGQYDFDEANFTAGESHTSYYDAIHVIASSRADGWDAVKHVGGRFSTSLLLTASDAHLRPANRAAAAFDGTPGTRWQSVNAAAAWLLYRYPAGGKQVVTSYAIASSDAAARDPKDWTLEASDDGITWTPLDHRLGETFASRGPRKTHAVGNTTAYSYYGLAVTRNNRGAVIQSMN